MKKTLKIMLMLMCATTIATLTSCSKDDEDLIVGEWKCYYADLGGNTNSLDASKHIGEIWTFTSDGILKMDRDGDVQTATYTVSDGIMLMGGILPYNIEQLTNSKMTLSCDWYGDDGEALNLKFNKM